MYTLWEILKAWAKLQTMCNITAQDPSCERRLLFRKGRYMAMHKEHNKNVAPGCEEPRSKVVCGMVDALGRAQRSAEG